MIRYTASDRGGYWVVLCGRGAVPLIEGGEPMKFSKEEALQLAKFLTERGRIDNEQSTVRYGNSIASISNYDF